MFIPIPASSHQPAGPDPVADLKVALRLLSGKDCVRDASQAQVILLRLAEGTDATLSSDATRILKAGVSNDWFGDKLPRHFELERIAEASLTRGSTNQLKRTKMAIVAGILSLVMGIGVYFAYAGESDLESVFPVLVGLILFTLLAFVVLQQKSKS